MKVLVTGGAGFIGSNLTRSLLERGDEVRVLDNFSTGSRANLEGLDVEVVEGELRSYERVHNAVRGVEVVFHLGALGSVPRSVQDPLTSSAVNVEGTLNVLLAARDEGVRRVVYSSSSSVYGPGRELPAREDAPPDPISPYGVAKLAAERYCISFSRVYDSFESVVVRYFNVFGPRQSPHSQYAAMIPLFLSWIAAGDPVTIYGDGDQSPRLHLRLERGRGDVAAADTPEANGRVFNLAASRPATVNEVADLIGRILDRPVLRNGRAAAARRHPRLLGRRHRRRETSRLAADRRRSTTASARTADALLGWPERIRVLRVIARLNMGGPALHVSYLLAGSRARLRHDARRRRARARRGLDGLRRTTSSGSRSSTFRSCTARSRRSTTR